MTTRTKQQTPAPKTEPSSAASTTSSKSKSAQPQTMADLMAQMDHAIVVAKKGERVKGKIAEKQKGALLIDIGAKTLGVVTDREFAMARDYIDELEIGADIEAIVVSVENDRGQVQLSLKQAAVDARWELFEAALEEEKVLSAKGVETNRGGMIVVVEGVRGFVPSSQFGKEYMGNIDALIGKTFPVKAIEVDRDKNRLIFSERHVSEADELAQRDLALEMVEAGAIYEGVVSGVMHFGLFVTVEVPVDKAGALGHVEGLIHISEISWEKVDHPKNYHQVGDRLKVKVLGVDEKTGKLNLSIKQLSDDPWKDIDKDFPVTTTLTGTVSRVEPFGVFVNVEAGVDGLIHASKLDPSITYTKGDKVTVTVESVDPERRRMSLSPVLTEVPVGYK